MSWSSTLSGGNNNSDPNLLGSADAVNSFGLWFTSGTGDGDNSCLHFEAAWVQIGDLVKVAHFVPIMLPSVHFGGWPRLGFSGDSTVSGTIGILSLGVEGVGVLGRSGGVEGGE